jgi:hypothetical protein
VQDTVKTVGLCAKRRLGGSVIPLWHTDDDPWDVLKMNMHNLHSRHSLYDLLAGFVNVVTAKTVYG